MLLKSSIERQFKRDFYNLVQIFKKYGYLKTMGSYNSNDVKYITDIDIQFRMNNKYTSSFDNYYNALESILTNLNKFLTSSKTHLIFEVIKVFEGLSYDKLNTTPNITLDKMDISQNTLLYTINNKIYNILDILKDKNYVKKIYDISGIVKINMFFTHNNGMYYIPIDLVMIQNNKLSEDLNNVKNCILYKLASEKKNYIKSFKKISSCILILDRLNIIKLPIDLQDVPKLSSHAREPKVHSITQYTLKHKKGKHTNTIKNITNKSQNKVSNVLPFKVVPKKLTKLNKMLKGQIQHHTLSLKDKLKYNKILVSIYRDIEMTVNANYYIYSIFNYVDNIDKIINLPDILFTRLYNKHNIYTLGITFKKIITNVLKYKPTLNINNKSISLLNTIYKLQLTMSNYNTRLPTYIKVLQDIGHTYQLSFKLKAESYYSQYIEISNNLL